jgi:rhodanese-related sulfurtransferase
LTHVTFITIEQLLEMIANDETFKLVDVLPEASYRDGHIPNAINIPVSRLAAQAHRFLEKNERIVVYCRGYNCEASTKAARTLLKLGYADTLDFKAGKRGRRQAGFGLDKKLLPTRSRFTWWRKPDTEDRRT